ncbi:G-patch-domain Zn-finger DNA-binding protein, partial [Mycena pura]
MDVDGQDPYKYDEYVSRPVQEVITVDSKIKPTNKGFALLAKLGWVEGKPLGLSEDGRVDPVPFQIKRDSMGVGKWNQDFRMIETTVSQRRELDSERMTKETDDQRRAREDVVARRLARENELTSAIKAFYCELCDKQFKTVVAYTEHTNSYAHHHKARFRDMQASIRIPPSDVDKRKEKERKREEKELRKIAAANGIKIPKPVVTAASSVPTDPVGSGMDIDGIPINFGVAPASASSSMETEPGLEKLGWASVGSTSLPATVPPPETASRPSSSSHPGFRTAGFTSLDTGTSAPYPLGDAARPPPPDDVPPPPPPAAIPPPPARGWTAI